MRLNRTACLTLAAALAAIFVSTAAAEAQDRNGRPLVIKRRSFLDTGNVVPVGSQSHYVTDTGQLNRTPDYYSQRGRYGLETLPGPFDLPGR